MIGTLIIHGQEYPIAEVELLLPFDGETRWMYLTVGGEDPNVGFGMWEVEFALLRELDDLDGKRMHVRPDYSTYDDDTLGTDITGMYSTTDINYLKSGEQAFSFGEVQLDFERIRGKEFRCRFEATLTDNDDGELDELPASAFWAKASAEFVVSIQERRPED